MKTLTAKDAKYGFGRLIDLARAEPVAVAKHGRPVVVVLAVEEYERFRKVTLTASDLGHLTVLEPQRSFNGDGRLLRLGLQAYALGIAYEFDPYFGLSISRVDPLPHQLAAIYDYLLKLARVRFLLADDAGAGKTIMSGLLIRELELRGLAERILIVCPANLAFQWQRELKEKFDVKFLVMKGQDNGLAGRLGTRLVHRSALLRCDPVCGAVRLLPCVAEEDLRARFAHARSAGSEQRIVQQGE